MRFHRPATALVLASFLLAGCANTAFVFKSTGEEFSEGNYIMGTLMVCALPVMVPIFMVADGFELLGITDEDVAAVGQATQQAADAYVAAKAAQQQQDAAAQQAAYQQQLALQQQQLRQPQVQVPYAPQAQPQGISPPEPQPSPQDAYTELQQRRVAEANAQVRQQAEQLAASNLAFAEAHAGASDCLSLVPMSQSNYGGFINRCSYKVNVTWCNDGANGKGLGNFSDSLDCRKGQFGLDAVGANGQVAAHTNAPQVYWLACKSPFYPTRTTFTGSGVTGGCKQ